MKRILALCALLSLPAALLHAAEPKAKPSKPPHAAAKREKAKDEPYRIAFKTGTAELTPSGEKLLTKVIQTLAAFPLYKVEVEAFAAKTEKDPEGLAQRRAEKLRSRIISWKPAKPSVMGMPLKPVAAELVETAHSVSPKPRETELKLVPLEEAGPRSGAPVP
jgi:outer membrane protein OmpA-like peptidoglycan-associated protein